LLGKEWVQGDSFFRYQRQAAGESLLIWSDGWRVANYAEFVELEKQGDLDGSLKGLETSLPGTSKSIGARSGTHWVTR